MDPSQSFLPSSLLDQSTIPTCESRKLSLRLTYGSIAFVGIGLMVYRVVSAYRMEGLFVYEGGDEKEKDLRISTRGTLTSALSSIVLIVLSFILKFSSSPDQLTLSLLFQLIFGNLVGYILDTSFGSEDGVRLMKEESISSSMKMGVASLSTSNFARYVVVVLLDMFISSLFMEYVLRIPSMTSGVTNAYLTCPPANIFLPLMSSMLIGLLTFYGYVNRLKFKFAIRSNHFPEEVLVWKKMTKHSETYKKYIELGTLDSRLKDILEEEYGKGDDMSFQSLFGRGRGSFMMEGPDPALWSSQSSRDQILEINTELKRGRDKVVSYTSVSLAAILASLIYLIKETNGGKGVSSLPSKMIIVSVMFGMLIYLDSDPELPPLALDEEKFRNGMGIVAVVTFISIMTIAHTIKKKHKYLFGCLASSLLILTVYTSTTESWMVSTSICFVLFILLCIAYYVYTSRKTRNESSNLGMSLPSSRL